MKLIVKHKEPKEWVEYRNTPNVSYESKPFLREALYDEQGGICAYCMRRLDDEHDRSTVSSNKIEHLKSQSVCTREEAMDYSNMVLCCNGQIAGTACENTHCDTHKGEDEIHFSPFEGSFIQSVSYKHDGTILSNHQIWNNDFNVVLNLNQAMLVENRHAALKGLVNTMGKGKWGKAEINRQISSFSNRDANGLYKPYCEMIVWFLRKRLSKMK